MNCLHESVFLIYSLWGRSRRDIKSERVEIEFEKY